MAAWVLAEVEDVARFAAISQLRVDSDGRAYFRRKRAKGKKPLEAIGRSR